MEKTYQRQIEEVTRLRHRLSELEALRTAASEPVPSQVYQEFMQVILQLEEVEKRLRRSILKVRERISTTHTEIVSTLHAYLSLQKQMRAVEDLFLANIIRPARSLQFAKQQHTYLEHEYRRIESNIRQERYATHQELEQDVRQVLHIGDTFTEQDPGDDGNSDRDASVPPLADLLTLTGDDVEDAIVKSELIAEFKRVVLPAVHPDSSQSSPEEFNEAFTVYKKMDFLLMQAYLVQYEPAELVDTELDPLLEIQQQAEKLEQAGKLLTRLRRRLTGLKQDLTEQETVDPEQVHQKMQEQRQELLERIRQESEHILTLREKLEALLD
ncbi:MAG: hypothetical protein GYA52_11525 [Chloroflexi bacterium]|nr:hypothetical protein [Chloroflexota bacterium]